VTASVEDGRLYGVTDITSIACNSADPGNGIGIGPGQVSSALCTDNTLATSNAPTTLFADPVYFTREGNFDFGNNAYDRVHERW
jgi:hypothetical protein